MRFHNIIRMFALVFSVFAFVAAECENTKTMLAFDKIFPDNREIISNLNEPDTNFQSAEEWFKKGVAAYENNDKGKAIEYYRKAIELKPDYADAYFCIGFAYKRWWEKEDTAIEYFKKAIELKPDYAEAYANMGIAYGYWKEEYEKAIECYNKAIELKPDYAEAYVNMGRAYMRWKKQYKKAIECFEKAIALKPDLAQAYFNMGEAYFGWRKQCKKAIKYYEKAIELNPDYIMAYMSMAFAYVERGNLKKSEECMKKAREIQRDDSKRRLLEKEFE
ncbi:MAG: tetratricopeptide repeat protein [Bacteroidales bacterium]|nr:tetratricopeptide repeat protein [Bacteroidales bacterium]